EEDSAEEADEENPPAESSLEQTQTMDDGDEPKLVPPDETQVFDSAPKAGSEQQTAVFEQESAAPTPAPPKPPSAVQKNTLGDYRLIKKLGAGGMGEVYKAHQISLDREVALKILSKKLSKDRTFVERFLREARLMSRLDHTNVIRCFGVGEQDGWHYLAMEFVDGGSIE